jgi:orotate phosphoribosyltransferase
MKDQIARALLEIGAVGFTPSKPITFKSGILSPVYVDNRTLPYHPEQWSLIIQGFQALIQQGNLAFDVIAGVAVGGVPHSAALAYSIRRPSVFIRKEAKEHGKARRIEGGEVSGKRVLLIEDLVTTGGSSLSGVHALREEGAIVTDMLAIVSYGFQEAQHSFATDAVTLHTLTDFDTILQQARTLERFSAQEESVIRNWFSDPYNWSPHSNQ